MITISALDANSFVESVILDSILYRLRLNWNDDGQYWTLDVCNNDNSELVRGIVVVPNFPLLHAYRRIKGLPPGELLAVVSSTSISDIGRKDFISGRARLIYMPKEELTNVVESAV